MTIWIISDGKRGHLNQSEGLARELVAEALRRHPGSAHATHIVSIDGISRSSKIFYLGKELGLPAPDLLIGAGHGTHIPLLHMARHYKAYSIVCMKPSLPSTLFDLCLIPRHDLIGKPQHNSSILPTIGAIHGIKPSPGTPKKHTLILIGGPSKEFDWDEETLINQLTDITRHNAIPLLLTTSRRTPKNFVPNLRQACPGIRIVPVEETDASWVPAHLAEARDIWVSQDSVSMVYESLGTGVPVGILDMPPRSKTPSRVAQGLRMLIDETRVTPYRTWASSHRLATGHAPLLEAERIAADILDRYPDLLHRT